LVYAAARRHGQGRAYRTAERLELKSPLFEAGRIYLPEETDWLLDFERELLASPFWKHPPDMVDAFYLQLTMKSIASGSRFYFIRSSDIIRKYRNNSAWRIF
jgi:phage terminase large subunit-like protein